MCIYMVFFGYEVKFLDLGVLDRFYVFFNNFV